MTTYHEQWREEIIVKKSHFILAHRQYIWNHDQLDGEVAN